MPNKPQSWPMRDNTPSAPPGAEVQVCPTPFFELRVGGCHLTIQRVPYGLIAFATAVGGAVSGVTWIAGR